MSYLKQTQVDYEAIKHENCRFKEDVEELQSELNDITKLKVMVERNLEESIVSLQQEREQKHAIKKELDQKISNESIKNLQSLVMGFGLDPSARDQHDEDMAADTDAPSSEVLKQMEDDFCHSDGEYTSEADSFGGGDLFSEIHSTHSSQLGELEQQIQDGEMEKQRLRATLEETSARLHNADQQMTQQQNKLDEMLSHITGLVSSAALEGMDENGELDLNDSLDDTHPEIALVRKNFRRHEMRYGNAQKEILHLRSQLVQYQGQAEENGLSRDAERKELEEDLKAMTRAVGESEATVNNTQEDLVKVAEELVQLYHHICEVNGDTPSRVLLEHVRGRKVKDQSGSDQEKSPEKELCPNKENNGDKGDPITCYRLTETLQDQIKYLKKAIVRLIESKRHRTLSSSEGVEEEINTTDAQQMSVEFQQLQELNVKYKAMLSTKREQVATLRSVLKANKTTAETALANLKQKYESEKSIVTETMAKLRGELKALKEDAVAFASLRAMFAQRCDEYVTQLDEQQRQLCAAEEEKKTLNSLLRMAIQQKLALTQRLEDLEFDRERRTIRRGGNSSGLERNQGQAPRYGGRIGGPSQVSNYYNGDFNRFQRPPPPHPIRSQHYYSPPRPPYHPALRGHHR